MSTRISLTGHRPNKLDGYNLNTPFYARLRHTLMDVIQNALIHHDIVHCHSGMALGADTIWAEAIIQMKQRYPGRVTFTAHIPCVNQENRWPAPSQNHYHELLTHADSSITYAKHYTPACMQERNIGMTNACDGLIAIWDGTPGGTSNCVHYAKSVNKHIHIIAPNTI